MAEAAAEPGGANCETGSTNVATGKKARALLRGLPPRTSWRNCSPTKVNPKATMNWFMNAITSARKPRRTNRRGSRIGRRLLNPSTVQPVKHDAAGQREHGDGERAEVRLPRHRRQFAAALD